MWLVWVDELKCCENTWALKQISLASQIIPTGQHAKGVREQNRPWVLKKPTSFAEHLKDGSVEVVSVTEDTTVQTSEKRSR